MTDILFPFIYLFFREAEHQVDADVFNPAVPYSFDGFFDLFHRMAAMEEAKSVVTECLDTHADAVNRKLPENIAELITDIIGIAFHRHLHLLPVFGSHFLSVHIINI